jgi:microcystin synthetase protein McyA
MSISWSAHWHAKADVQAIADTYLESLRAIVHHCRNSAVAGYQPSDFPLADLDQQSLENLISQVEF